jgi:hypothetical protein
LEWSHYVLNVRDHPLSAGLESLAGASRDLDIIFEVEQEIGEYYSGWDDDGAFSELGEAAVLDDDEEEEESKGGSMKDSQPGPIASSPTTSLPARPPGMPPATPPVGMAGRPRHGSMPVGREMSTVPFPRTSDFSLRRRRESVVEPSPLAKLFITDPQGLSRRASRANSMSFAAGNNNLNNFQFAARTHARKDSQGVNPAQHPIQPISEGRSVTFSVPGENGTTASALVSKEEEDSPLRNDEETLRRLAAIDSRQKRIEDLLEALVKEKVTNGS